MRGEGERLIEPSGWCFPPKFPSILLKLNNVIRQGDWVEESGTFCSRLYSQALKMSKIGRESLVNMSGFKSITLFGQIL